MYIINKEQRQAKRKSSLRPCLESEKRINNQNFTEKTWKQLIEKKIKKNLCSI